MGCGVDALGRIISYQCPLGHWPITPQLFGQIRQANPEWKSGVPLPLSPQSWVPAWNLVPPIKDGKTVGR